MSEEPAKLTSFPQGPFRLHDTKTCPCNACRVTSAPKPPSCRDGLLALHELLCSEARELMKRKNHDYASEADPYRNFRMFGAMGILVRLSDKLARLRSFEESGNLSVTDESVRDTVLDLINYAVLYAGYKACPKIVAG